MGTYIRLVDFNNSIEKEEQFFNQENRHQANQKEFEKIPGSPVAYWVSDRVKEIFENSEKLEEVSDPRLGMATADNERFMRLWHEINNKKIGLNLLNRDEAQKSLKKWFPYSKGGEYRKWYGNYCEVVNWENDGEDIRNFKDSKGKIRSHNYNLEYIFKKGVTWSALSSYKFSARILPQGFLFDNAGSSLFLKSPKEEELNEESILALINNEKTQEFLEIINPTLNFQPGNLSKLPIIKSRNNFIKNKMENFMKKIISISKQEWDSRETSWDFEANGLIFFPKKTIGMSPSTTTEDSGQVFVEKNQRVSLIKEAYESYCNTWKEKFHQIHQNEEELNRLFIEIYGLESEMDEKVALEDITLLKKESKIVDGELVFNPEELVKQFLSYGVGCIMGRYSLDKKGLIIANSDDELITENNSFIVKGTDGEVRHQIENPKFIPEPFGIIPVVKENIFSNDIVEKITEFVTAVYGEATLEENLEFIADSLGRKGNESSRDTIRKYFIKDFYKDHLQRYKKRPIYWMMNSGKKDAFSSLIYLHRYENNTIGRVRADYLVKYQETLNRYKDYYDRIVTDSETVPKDRKEAEKKLKELDGELKELRDYANEVKHIADLKISLDLDDGVKVNYEKFGKILGKI